MTATKKKSSMRSVKAMKTHAEVMCKRIVIWRASRLTGQPMCERCHVKPGNDWAHNIPRAWSGTRCRVDNGWLLCRPCHTEIDKWPDEKLALTARTIGMARYQELRQMAQAHTTRPITAYRYWMDEVERLRTVCEELGLDTRASR